MLRRGAQPQDVRRIYGVPERKAGSSVCDNTVFVKKIPETEPVMKEFNAECGFPCDGAKEHFILDIEDRGLLDKVIPLLEKIMAVPKKRKK